MGKTCFETGDLCGTIELLSSKAEVISAELMKEFERLKAESPEDIFNFSNGYVNGFGDLAEDGRPCPAAPIKYVLYSRKHIEKFMQYIPFFIEHFGKKAFEIGVGPAYLLTLLKNVLNMDMHGIDIRLKDEIVYRRIREELCVDKFVFEHKVTSGIDIPIPDSTELLISFWTVFNRDWELEDHKWFIEHCRQKLVGDKELIFRFNNEGFLDKTEIRNYYKSIAIFPLKTDANFCIIRL